MFIKYNCYYPSLSKPIPEIGYFKSIWYDTDYNTACLNLKGLDYVYFKVSLDDYKVLVEELYSHLGDNAIELNICGVNVDTDEITNEEEFDSYYKECVGTYDDILTSFHKDWIR